MASETMVQNNTKGVNVEHPNVFMYNGRWYTFTANIFNLTTKENGKVVHEELDNQHIEQFSYVNEINSLYLTGELIYHDINGTISKYINKNYNHLTVVCSQLVMEQVGNGSGLMGQLQKLINFMKNVSANMSAAFQHTFIIENIEIMNRKENVITYRLKLISENWYKLIGKLEFSNYDKESNADEKNVFFILKTLFEQAGLETDEKTFNLAIKQTKDIAIDYIVGDNDSLLNIVPYLLNKLYFADNYSKIKHLLYIVYDIFNNNYRIIDYSNTETWLDSSRPAVVLSLFETSYEKSLFSENNNLATTKIKTQTDAFKSMFIHEYWSYDRNEGTFSNNSINILTDEIATKLNDKAETFSDVDGKTEEKYQLNLLPEAFIQTDKNRFSYAMQDTNVDYRMYNDMIDNFIARDALIVNCEGDSTHQPGTSMGIVLDRTIEKVPTDIPKNELEELYKKHRQIEQTFVVMKSRHIYKTTTPASYTENVVLARNFLLTPHTP